MVRRKAQVSVAQGLLHVQAEYRNPAPPAALRAGQAIHPPCEEQDSLWSAEDGGDDPRGDRLLQSDCGGGASPRLKKRTSRGAVDGEERL